MLGGKKKAIIKCHLAPVACILLPLSPLQQWELLEYLGNLEWIFQLSVRELYSEHAPLFAMITWKYNSLHYFLSITCTHLAFSRLLNDLEVMTLQCFVYTAEFSLLHKLLFN